LLITVVLAVLSFLIFRRSQRSGSKIQPEPPTLAQSDVATRDNTALPQSQPTLPNSSAESVSPAVPPELINPQVPTEQISKTNARQLVAKSLKSGITSQQASNAREGVRDPMARLALSYVGTDSEAETYWIGAINDSSLPAHERQDLIEDLNEDGLSDPKNPTV